MQLIKTDNTLPFNHLWLASNSTFMTDHDWFLYLGAVQIWQNLSEHHHYLTSTKSLIRQIGAIFIPFHSLNIFPFYIWLEGLKWIYYSVISFFSKYHFKTGTLFLLLPSHVIWYPTWKNSKSTWSTCTTKNRIKPPIGKIFWKYKLIRHYFVFSQK